MNGYIDPVIEIAHLREANDEWKRMHELNQLELKQLRTDLILLSRRNTLLVIEIEDMKQKMEATSHAQ